jgi:hypothetical protein
MSSYLAAVVVSCSALGVTGEAPERSPDRLQWSRHYDQAKRAARAAEQPLLVVIEDPSTPSERLDDSRLEAEQAKLLGDYHLCRVDVRTEYGRRVREAFGARELPFTAIIDKKSRSIVFQRSGQLTLKQWKDALVRTVTRPRHTVAKVISGATAAPTGGTGFGSSTGWQSLISSPAACFT